MVEYKTSKGKFVCLEGLHRPFNMPLCQLVWVCKFIVSLWKDEQLTCMPSEINYRFFKSHLKDLHHKMKSEKKIEGVIQKDNADLIYERIKKLNIKELKELISKVLLSRKEKVDRKIYSAYKNTSYYITLAKKLDLINERYYPSERAKSLARHKTTFFYLDSFQKDLIFRILVEKDKDMLIPLIISLPFEQNEKAPRIYLKYIEKCCDVTFFKYITKSQTSNYDKVRLSWIKQLGAVSKRGYLLKKYEWLKNEEAFAEHNENERKFLKLIVRNEVKMNKAFKQFERSYHTLVSEGKHDALFVNLYDIMSLMHCSYNTLNKIIVQYYEQKKEEKIVLFTNLVQSIDKRRRFYVKNQVPVLKVKII